MELHSTNKKTALFFSALNDLLVNKDAQFKGMLLNLALDTESSLLFEQEFGFEIQPSELASNGGQGNLNTMMIEHILRDFGYEVQSYVLCLDNPVSLHRFTESVLNQKPIESLELNIQVWHEMTNAEPKLGLSKGEIEQVQALLVGEGLIDFGDRSHTIIRVR